MGEIVTYIREIEKGNSSFFSNVVDKMMPSMKKYISRLYKDEKDDVYVELMAALWEAIIKIEYFDEEGKCITYLNNALNNKYMELYRRSRKKNDNEQALEDEVFTSILYKDEHFNEMIFIQDMKNFAQKYCGIKKEIFEEILIGNMSDVDIALKHSMSRQYIHRLRKEFYSLLKAEYFDNSGQELE